MAEFLDSLQGAVRDRLAFYELTAEAHDHLALARRHCEPGGTVNPDGEPYERDPAGWNAYLADGNARQARKRVSADAIIRDVAGRILLVDPTYKPDWDLPGGMAEANEPPAEALRRELREELGLRMAVGHLLCVDWVSPHGPWDDLLSFIFDGGTLSERDIEHLHLADHELRAFEFCDEGQATQRLRPYVWRRVAAGLQALKTGRASYLQDGYADATTGTG